MKRYLAASVILLLTSLSSFATNHQPSPYSQIRLKHARVPKKATSTAPRRPGDPANRFPLLGRLAADSSAQAHFPKARKFGITESSSAGFLSAVQIPVAGSYSDRAQSVLGDFKGDGNQSVATVVSNMVSGSPVYSISVVLSNGDGTFQAAQLTATPGNTDDPIVVGDVNGDGKDDIIMVHPNGEGGCRADPLLRVRPNQDKCEVSSFDVLISNGDGTFTLGNNYVISNFGLNGGVLTDITGNGKLDVLVIDSENPASVIEVLGNGDGTFQAPSTYATLSGPAPNDINFADFNGDGNLDFEGESGSQVMVYLASGSGSFAAPVALVTPDAAYNSCGESTGDLNGDGKPEIVSVNCAYNTITIYVNNGDGSFQTGVYYDNTFDTYVYPGQAAIADVNDDGKPDIVVGDSYGGNITVFLGNGDGTVTSPTVGFDTGGDPFSQPLIADFNGDGLLDVIIPDEYYSIVYLEGYGDGTFHAAPTYGLPDSFTEYAYTYSVASGAFTSDGFADVVAAQDGNTNSPGVAVYLSNGDGTLKPPVTYGTSNSLDYVAVADFNNDGNLDIAAADYANGVVQIFLGKGDGTFTVGQTFPTDTAEDPAPANVVAGDFNHDGNMDLAVINESDDTIGILLGNGDGTFGAPTTYPISASPNSLTAADLNGDGYLDLAVALDTDSSNLVAVFLANSDNSGTFKPEADVATGTGAAQDVTFGDFNGDGNLDMAVALTGGATYSGALVVALGNGDGTFQTPTPYPASTQAAGMGNPDPVNVQALDLNGDGNLDLVYVNLNFGTVAVMTGNGDGTFNTPAEFPTGAYAAGLALGDLDGDGSIAVVTGNDYIGGVSILLNSSGSGAQQNYTFTTQTPTATVMPGASATYNLTAAGRNGYSGTITFSCTGLPTGAACSFSPSSVAAKGDLPLNTTLTITTTAAGTAWVQPVFPNSNPGAPTFLATLAGLGLFGLVLAGSGRNRIRLQLGVLLGMMLLGMTFTLVGCGGTSTAAAVSTGTPAGSYTITVTATGTGTGAPTHTLNLTLVVE